MNAGTNKCLPLERISPLSLQTSPTLYFFKTKLNKIKTSPCLCSLSPLFFLSPPTRGRTSFPIIAINVHGQFGALLSQLTTPVYADWCFGFKVVWGKASHKSPTLDPLPSFCYILNTPFTLFDSVSFLKQLIYLFKQGYLERDLIMQPEIENLGD